MHTEGTFAPETAAAARERYESFGPTAQRVVREVAKAMDLDAAAYDERVTSDVVETAREVLFAGDLAVHVGDREEFDAWVDEREYEVTEFGSPNVDNVAWHAAPFADDVVAATFQDEEAAAVETLRRQALGHVYRDVVG
jgi:hypothetical protein